MSKRKPVSPGAAAEHDADVALAQRFDDLFAQARAAEQDLRDAQANDAAWRSCTGQASISTAP